MNIDHILQSQCIIALDTQNDKKLDHILQSIRGHFSWVKVGMELYYSQGRNILDKLHQYNFKVFLDLKLHDIPQTVHNAILSLNHDPFDLLSLHLQGGNEMLLKAHEAIVQNTFKAKLLGVSVLTSFNETNWNLTLHQQSTIKDSIQSLIAQKNVQYLEGIVCSGYDCLDIKKFPDLKTVVPGIRWQAPSHDQARIMTPALALKSGADYLVIGREITQAANIELSIKSLKEHLHEQL